MEQRRRDRFRNWGQSALEAAAHQFGGTTTRITEDRAGISFALAGLFGVGALLGLATLIFPGPPNRSVLGLGAVAVLALAAAATLTAFGGRLPLRVLRLVPALGSALVAAAVLAAGHNGGGAFGLYFFWVALAASYFFGLRWALYHTAFAIAAFAFALGLGAGTPAAGVYLIVLAGTLSIAVLLVALLRTRMERLVAQLEDAARTDSLTGVANRRALEERFQEEVERALRSGQPLGVVVVDLDGFKRINDRFGHGLGDEGLVRLAGVLERQARTIDTVARLGGDEFTILLPSTDADGALVVAERLRRSVEKSFGRWSPPITVSCGAAAFPIHGAAPAELLHAADEALYLAKAAGRNCSAVAPPGADGTAPTEPPLTAVDRRLTALLAAAEEVDRRKGGGAETWRVGLYAEALARALGLAADEAERVRLAARLHDVGKIGISHELLSASKPLAEDEWNEIRRHPEIGARMLKAAGLEEPSTWVLGHHERPDGHGYPNGLANTQIPLEARIVSVAEAYAAMQAERPYRPPLPPELAQRELRAAAGSQFDSEVVEALLGLGVTRGQTGSGETPLRGAVDPSPPRDSIGQEQG